MADPAPAPSMHADGSAPFSRTYLRWILLLLAIHAGIAIWAVTRVAETPWYYYNYEGFIHATLVGLATFGVAIAVRGRYTRAIAWNGTILFASALLTPAVALVVALLLLNAYVLGDRVLAYARSDDVAVDARRVCVAILAGCSLWIGIISVTAPLPIHFVATYAIALLLPLLFWWRTTADALARAGRVLVAPGPPTSAAERGWTVLLMVVVLLHLFIVTKPETGYDALAMHLQIPVLTAHAHAWPFAFTRYAWAVMPLGADWMFTAAYFTGGEEAARLLNFCFAALACMLLYELMRLYARRDVALAGVCLVASMPLAFLETSTLHVESLWTAFLLGTLVVGIDYLRAPSTRKLVALALLAAGAMQCKVIAVIWLVPLLSYVGYRVWRQQGYRDFAAREAGLVALATAFAAWPYANAWLLTGNPVFPFMNSLFRSEYFDSATSFNNPLYNAPLRPWTLYEMVWSSGRFIEGSNGAIGFHWLLLFPVIVLAFTRRRPLVQWLCLALAAIFFIGVYSQQSYLRYLLPFLALVALLGGWAFSEIPDGRATRAAILLVGGLLCVVNVRLIYSANWNNLTLCTRCGLDDRARQDYLAQWGPDRVVAEYLNRNLRDARVGYYSLGGNAAGYVGYSRAGNWHDYTTFRALAFAESADELVHHAKMFGLTHIVYRDPANGTDNPPLREFRAKHTVPIWRANGIVVGEIRFAPD